MPHGALTDTPADGGKHPSGGAVGTPDQRACRIALRSYFRGGYWRENEEKSPGTVSPYSLISRAEPDIEITRRLKCVHENLLAEQGRVVANTESMQRVDDLVDEVREVIMDYQVCRLDNLFPLCLILC